MVLAFAIAFICPLQVVGQQSSPQALYDQAGQAFDAGDTAKVIQLCEELLQQFPDSALSGRKPGAILGNNIHPRVLAMQPDGRGRTRNVQNHLDPAGLQLGDDLVPPAKVELARGWLE
jgi:hypothetical protein